MQMPPVPFHVIVGEGAPPARGLAARREDELVIVARDAGGLDGRFGVSGPVADHAGVPQAYREATLALSYATKQRPIVVLDDLSAFECLLVGADATTRAIVAAKPRLDGEDAATVEAFATADLNVTRAAQALQVHPNTVRYRLDRIAAETGLDPRTFAGLVELKVRAGMERL